MKLNYKEIGVRIRKARKAKNITQDELANIVHLSKTHISHIENATTKLSLPVLVDIANALDVTADYLIANSLNQATPTFTREINDILEDCSVFELSIMVEIMKLIKKAIRSNSSYTINED